MILTFFTDLGNKDSRTVLLIHMYWNEFSKRCSSFAQYFILRSFLELVWVRTTEERVEKEQGKSVPLVHLEAVGNVTQRDEQFQKAKVIQEIGFYCTPMKFTASCFVRTCLNMQDEYLLSRMASAVCSPGVVQRHQSVSCHTVSLTPHWVVCLYFKPQKLYIAYLCF